MNKPNPPPRPEGAKSATDGPANSEGGAEAYARWLQHTQRTRGRHAAITRNLYTWSNYKSWAEQVRGSWESSETGASNKPKK